MRPEHKFTRLGFKYIIKGKHVAKCSAEWGWNYFRAQMLGWSTETGPALCSMSGENREPLQKTQAHRSEQGTE